MNDYGTFRRHVAALPFELFMLVTAWGMYIQHDLFHVATALFTCLVSFLPLLLERWWKVRLPVWIQLTYVIFVFASMFMGEVFHFYGRYWWWDDVMHISSGVLMGLGSILWLQLAAKRGADLPGWSRLLLVFTSVITIAALWEFVEFGSDQLFGTHSQDDSLVDTMLDMIDAAVGAGIIVSVYARYLAKKPTLFMASIVRHFIGYNS